VPLERYTASHPVGGHLDEVLEDTSKCPSSVTPHLIRRGYITRLLEAGVSIEVVSDRCTVSPVVIDEHYDVRSEDEKMQQRQEVLREAL
jgi:integrase